MNEDSKTTLRNTSSLNRFFAMKTGYMILGVSQYVSGKIEMAPDLLSHRLLCLFTHCRGEAVEDPPISVFAATNSEGVS